MFIIRMFIHAFLNQFKKNRRQGDMDFDFAISYVLKVLR